MMMIIITRIRSKRKTRRRKRKTTRRSRSRRARTARTRTVKVKMNKEQQGKETDCNMFRMVHMVGVNLQWGFTQKNVQTKWSLSQESMAKNNEANQRCQLKGPSTVDDAAIRKKKWPSRKWAKIDLQTTWWNWIWLPKRFHPSKCEKYSETPQERRHPWKKTPNNNKKSKTPMGWLDLPFWTGFLFGFGCSMIFVQSQGRPFGSSRPFGSFGSGCAGTRASGARTSWTRGAGGWPQLPMMMGAPTSSKWIF